jgi:hypothetical protein
MSTDNVSDGESKTLAKRKPGCTIKGALYKGFSDLLGFNSDT